MAFMKDMSTWLSAVMKNFDVPHNASGVIRVRCKLCETYISGTSTSAGNFMKHLKRKHPDIYISLLTMKYKLDSSSKSLKNHTSNKNQKPQDRIETTEESPKKYVNYTPEFKVKVLEYYFKNGGEQKYGMKSKTAQVFKIDKKTINRMLCNPEMVTKAYKALNQKPPTILGMSNQSSENGISPQSGERHISSGQNPAVIDLPEDPDFSVLKQAISATASGIGSATRLLLTGTKEIQKIILEECEIIYECKVCRNLFRSVVNFLAHKRIYCQEQFVNVRSIFHKETCEGTAIDSNTVIVEPEPPDGVDQDEGTKIDKIATKLASKTINNSKLSSSTDKGSSKYYDMIERTQENRNEKRKDSSVVLNRISGYNKAVYQDYVPHGMQRPLVETKELARQAMENSMGVTAVLDENGKIIGTQPGTPTEIDLNNLKEIKINNSYFEASPADSPCDSLSVEENEAEESDLYERTIYTCPICSTLFLSMGGCNKHLLRVHKKKKHQRDRLRQVIASRTYKKTFTQEALKNYHLKSNADKTDENSSGASKTQKFSESKADLPQHREVTRVRPREMWRCNVCQKTFCSWPIAQSHVNTHLNCSIDAIPFLKPSGCRASTAKSYQILTEPDSTSRKMESDPNSPAEGVNSRNKRKMYDVSGSRKRKLLGRISSSIHIPVSRPDYEDDQELFISSIKIETNSTEISEPTKEPYIPNELVADTSRNSQSIKQEKDVGCGPNTESPIEHCLKSIDINDQITSSTDILQMNTSGSSLDIKMEPLFDNILNQSIIDEQPTSDGSNTNETTSVIFKKDQDCHHTNSGVNLSTSCPSPGHPETPSHENANGFSLVLNPVQDGAKVAKLTNIDLPPTSKVEMCELDETNFYRYKVEFEIDPMDESQRIDTDIERSQKKGIGKLKFTKLADMKSNDTTDIAHQLTEEMSQATNQAGRSKNISFIFRSKTIGDFVVPQKLEEDCQSVITNSISADTMENTVKFPLKDDHPSMSDTCKNYSDALLSSYIVEPSRPVTSTPVKRTNNGSPDIDGSSGTMKASSSSEKVVKTFQKLQSKFRVQSPVESQNPVQSVLKDDNKSNDLCLDVVQSAETTIDVNLSFPTPSFGYLGFQSIMDYPLAFPRPDETKVCEESDECSIKEIKYSWDL